VDDTPEDWSWLADAEPTRALPGRAPWSAAASGGHVSIDKPPRRARKATSVFWSVRQVPDFTKFPRVIRFTCYRGVQAGEVSELLRRAAECAWLQELGIVGPSDIDVLPDEIGALSGLYRLDLSSNRLSTVPSRLTELPRLEDLVLSDNPLSSLPEDFGALSMLEHLQLGGRTDDAATMTAMPLSMTALQRLRHLSLTSLPALENSSFLTSLPALRTLELSGLVTVHGVPEELPDLTQLEGLALTHHKRDELPSAIRSLRGLEVLYLVNNDFVRLPQWLPELSQLRMLAVFGGCRYEASAVVDIIERLPSLLELFLWMGFAPEQRARLKALGFRTNRSNPSRMTRGDEPVVDPFPFIR